MGHKEQYREGKREMQSGYGALQGNIKENKAV
jgi:hypothetical protein